MSAEVRSSKLEVRSFLVIAALLIASTTLGAERPDLVVVISIDQFRYEYLERFYPYFAPDGFRRFIDRGADFTKAYYPYANTITGPGHASIGTGYTPSQSGIVGNDWYDRNTGKTIYCVEDPRVAGGFSPVNLQSDSLGDRLQEKFPGARVYGVAVKDRAAILMAGRKATAAYWFEPKNGGFQSSAYYRSNSTLMSAYNATLPQYLSDHPEWTQSSFIPAADLAKLTTDPESLRKDKTNRLDLDVKFPHPIKSLDALTYTPFGNGIVIGFAEKLIETEKLGTNANAPDLLYVGLSSPDYLGHFYGPDSLEVADSCVRTDRDIAGFLGWLDARFKDRYTIAVSADHGVQSMPSVARLLGREAGRVSITTAAGRAELERLAAASLGANVNQTLVVEFEEPSLYLDWAHIAAMKLDGEQVKRALRDAALKLPGVAAAFTNTELMIVNPAASGLELALRLCFRADRSGDVLVTLKPGYMWGTSAATGTTHGQFVEEDRHVPILLWGRGVTARKYAMQVAPTDIARSIGSLFGVDAGGPQSIILPSMPGGDIQAAIRTALAEVSYKKIIAGEMLGAEARNVMVFDPAPRQKLPEGYARLDSVHVNGDNANVRVWLGPIPEPSSGIQLACGTGYTFQLVRDASGVWKIVGRGVIVC